MPEDTPDLGPIASRTDDLTTPTGAELIVLPRPPARTSAVFADAYVAPFVASGTAVTAVPTTAQKAEGTTSLQINLQAPNAEYAAVITAAEAPYDAASQTELTFAFNAGATVHAGIDTLAVAVDDDNAATAPVYVTLKPYLVPTGNVAASTWYRVNIPMSVLNPGGRPLRRVLIANKSTLSNVPFFLDDVRLSWTDAAPQERAVYTDALGAGFSHGGWSVAQASDTFRSTGANARKGTFTAAWGALTFVYDWNQAAFASNAFSTVSFDISAGPGTPPAAMNSMRIGLDFAPTKTLSSFVPGGFKANTWHRVTIPVSALSTQPFRAVTFKNESTSLYSFYVDNVRFQKDGAAPPLRTVVPPVGGDPDTFAAGEVDVETIVRTASDRKAVSPLLYGVNVATVAQLPADFMRCVTLVRRGGDRANTYNWETNVSNGGPNNGWGSDMYLAQGLPNQSVAGALDQTLIARNRAAGRASMVPFVLNGYVSGPVASNISFATGWNRDAFFRRVEVVKPTALSLVPDLNDGVVYTDEHLNFLKSQFPGDIYAPGATQTFVGIDNEPDLYAYNFPMLQAGSGDTLVHNGVAVGKRVTGDEFTARFLTFAKRVKQLSPSAAIVGPDHYGFDGWTSWYGSMIPRYQNSTTGAWYMDDFLKAVRTESQNTGTRLLETWDMHWYPQRVFNGVFTNFLDHTTRPMTADEISAVVQGPRSYWDPTYDEQSWITRDHLRAPANILNRLQARIDAYYPGTKLGVTEYFPGGRGHIASGLAVADTLGVFARQGLHMAALWPHPGNVSHAYGAIKLLRNPTNAAAIGATRFGDTLVRVEHPEKDQSSVFATSDNANTVTVLVVNKTNATRRFGLRAFHSANLGTFEAYRIDQASPNPYLAAQGALSKRNAYAYAAPPMTATLLVFRAP